MKNVTIAVIGSGHMGSCLAGGLINNQFPPEQIWISDPDTAKLQQIKTQLKVHVTENNHAAVEHADVVILAIKPQAFAAVLKDLMPIIQKNKPLIISIAAGIREQSIQKIFGDNIAIVRAMPNTPALLGAGATALFANQFVSADQRDIAESILRAVGIAVWIDDEKLMDVITPLSGSGPAYFFLVMEALEKAAIELGLPSQTARLLTLQTAYGAARMALESDVDAAELRKKVTSPGGTTERAVEILENDIHELFSKALAAAKVRSEELAKLLEHV